MFPLTTQKEALCLCMLDGCFPDLAKHQKETRSQLVARCCFPPTLARYQRAVGGGPLNQRGLVYLDLAGSCPWGTSATGCVNVTSQPEGHVATRGPMETIIFRAVERTCLDVFFV